MNLENYYESLQLETDLRKAIERKEFQLHYQPKLDLDSGKITGVEALIRWKHPERGLISPFEFIPFAEEIGLIIPIGEWVLRTACEQAVEWQEQGLFPLIMAVNLSARQLNQPNLVDKVQSILEETGLSPEYLELEITESMMMDVHRVLPILRDLKRTGVRISLDDFGTGYSSLYYLKEFPIDIIKIDRSFVRYCTIDTKDATIVKAIIAMTHQLNLEIIAEGIESKDHLTFLQQNLCNKGQGNLFSQPLPPDEFVQNFGEIEQVVNRVGIPQAISNQQRLEKALKNARLELQDTVRNQQGMILKFKKRNGKFIHTLCDGELLYRLGFSPEQLIGKELHDFLPKESAERKLKFYHRAWEGEDVTYEGKHNGTWYLASLRPIRKGGQVVEVIGSCVDISKRKESEERYRRLVELSPEPIVVYHRGFIQYANPACVKLLGASSLEELIGKSIMDYFDCQSVCLIEKRIKELNQIGMPVAPVEEKIIKVDGTLVDVEVTGITIVDDGRPAFLMIYHDITRRKRVEEALRKSDSMYRLIAENMQDLIKVLDTNGIVKYASPSHEMVLGFLPQVYEGHSFFELINPEDISYIQKQFVHTVSTKTPCQVEFRYKHANGGWVYVEACVTLVLCGKGEVDHLVVVSRDISERKKSEEIVRKSEKLSVVGQLAAGVAHEIRNPLTSIKGFVQLQKESNKPLYNNVILSEIERLENIVGEFLTFAKPQITEIKEIEVKNFSQQVILLLDSQAIMNNIKIVQEYGSDIPSFYCDENQIKQVFINVLQNAVEAMPNGGIIKVQIHRYLLDYIQFRIIDQGTGISEERMKNIGEPFFSTKEKGTGLGLMICHRIVQEHGGTISIDSAVNQGTTVDIILPINPSFALKR